MSDHPLEGGCLCGQVRYKVSDDLAGVIACHCRECRKMSGHFFAATAAPRDTFEITIAAGLRWFGSSSTSRRGFCGECGSSLFFDHGPQEPIGIAAGSFDGDPPLTVAAHIYVDEAGKYYSIDDGAEQYDAGQWRDGGWGKLRRK